MSVLLVKATMDVPDEPLHTFAVRLAPRIGVEVDPSRAFFKSVTAPSWVKLLETREFWITTLAGSLAWDGVKATIGNRRAIIQAVKAGTGAAFTEFLDALSELAANLGQGTELLLGLPLPDDWFATVMILRSGTSAEMEEDLALFLANLPAIERFLTDHHGQLTGPTTLKALDDGAVQIQWMDRATLTPQLTIVSVKDVA